MMPSAEFDELVIVAQGMFQRILLRLAGKPVVRRQSIDFSVLLHDGAPVEIGESSESMLLDFEQSLNADQRSRFAVATSQGSLDRQIQSGNIAGGCGSPSAIDWSIDEIEQSVRPTTAQRDVLDDVRRSFDDAARDLETHFPTTIPASVLSRLDHDSKPDSIPLGGPPYQFKLR
jgi:hypothetical protein